MKALIIKQSSRKLVRLKVDYLNSCLPSNVNASLDREADELAKLCESGSCEATRSIERSEYLPNYESNRQTTQPQTRPV